MRAQRFGHVVNIVTWGMQMKAPKFAAYIASKTALDMFGRIAGREAYFDNVTFTNMRLALVRTPMTAPTEAYAGRRASPPSTARRGGPGAGGPADHGHGLVGSVGRGASTWSPPALRPRVRRFHGCARLGRRRGE